MMFSAKNNPVIQEAFDRVQSALASLVRAQASQNRRRIRAATTRLKKQYAHAVSIVDETFRLRA